MFETPSKPDEDAGTYFAALTALHVERLGAIARVLDRHEIRLGLEVIGVETSHSGRGVPFVTRLAELGPIHEALHAEAPNVGILVDFYHLYAAGEDLAAGLAWGVEEVVWVHIADLDPSARADRRTIRDEVRGLPGEHGAIDCGRWLRELAAAGYTGPVTVEPMGGCRALSGLTAEDAAHRVAGTLRSVWPRRRG